MAVRIWTGKDANAPAREEDYEVSWVGQVVGLREMNGYDDSDFYAIVWDAAEGRTREVWYATTRGWTYRNSAAVDATEEVWAAYNAWRQARADEAAAAQAAWEAAQPRKGRTVTVVKGRKVPLGTTGTVIWTGPGYRGGERVGIKDAEGEVYWTAASNVEVVPAGTAS
jgi:hypothetical protein